MKKLAVALMLLASTAHTIYAKNTGMLIGTEYSLSPRPADEQHLMITEVRTYKTATISEQKENGSQSGSGVPIPAYQSQGQVTSSQTKSTTYTEEETYAVKLDDAMYLGIAHKNMDIVKAAVRKGARVGPEYLGYALDELDKSLANSDWLMYGIKGTSAVIGGALTGAAFHKLSPNPWAQIIPGSAATVLVWLGIRQLQNYYIKVNAPELLEYLVYQAKCYDSAHRAALIKLHKIMNRHRNKRRTIQALVPLEIAISELPTV